MSFIPFPGNEPSLNTPIAAAKPELIRFLQEELALPDASIEMAVRHSEQEQGPIPMVLWRYGLVNLQELEQIYDWMEAAA